MKETVKLTKRDFIPFQFDDAVVDAVFIDGELHVDADAVISCLGDQKPNLKIWLINFLEGPITRDFEDMLVYAAVDGKRIRLANPVALFRLIQSIKGGRAESLRRKLAEVAFERAKEEANPELAVNRAITQFKRIGRTESWIKARLRSIQARHALTDEWKERGIIGQEYGALTNVLHRETFEVEVQQHATIKSLGRQHNLRDHMDELELTLTTLAEQTTRAIAVRRDARGYVENKNACHAGGSIAGSTRKRIESELGTGIVNRKNFLDEDENLGLPPER